jgi:hypothetical protein
VADAGEWEDDAGGGPGGGAYCGLGVRAAFEGGSGGPGSAREVLAEEGGGGGSCESEGALAGARGVRNEESGSRNGLRDDFAVAISRVLLSS